MKRVIDGKSYNTDTATIVAKWEYKDQDDYDTEATLYQTRGGAFFIVDVWENDEGHPKVYFETMSRDEVRRLVERTDNLAIINGKMLDEPPEAAEGETPGATLYLRVPASLKERVEVAASEAKLSVNAWAMRCIENCLGDPFRDLPPDEREAERLMGLDDESFRSAGRAGGGAE
jgi:hypothetical protein